MITSKMEAVSLPIKDKGLIISSFRKWFNDTRSGNLSILDSALKDAKSKIDKKAAKYKCG